jgi:hypothetical protein
VISSNHLDALEHLWPIEITAKSEATPISSLASAMQIAPGIIQEMACDIYLDTNLWNELLLQRVTPSTLVLALERRSARVAPQRQPRYNAFQV